MHFAAALAALSLLTLYLIIHERRRLKAICQQRRISLGEYYAEQERLQAAR